MCIVNYLLGRILAHEIENLYTFTPRDDINSMSSCEIRRTMIKKVNHTSQNITKTGKCETGIYQIAMIMIIRYITILIIVYGSWNIYQIAQWSLMFTIIILLPHNACTTSDQDGKTIIMNKHHLPGIWLKTSQLLKPLPSSRAAPSICFFFQETTNCKHFRNTKKEER